jgi:sphingolipid 4-desaturase/C4-monooxygenase
MSSDYHWHIERRKQILKEHPRIENYFGNYPLSIVPILFLVVFQWSIAWIVRDMPWWTIGLISFSIGQFILHALATFIHEAAHNLIFKGRFGSIASLMIIELGTLSFGKSLSYCAKHAPSHHQHLNEYFQDYEWWDINRAKFLQENLSWRFFQTILHLFPGGAVLSDLIIDSIISTDDRRQIKTAKKPLAAKLVLIVNSLLLYSLAWFFMGWQATLYFFWSLSWLIGNWGVTFSGQSIAEHHIYQQGKTYSTYHWTNVLFFNTGYHDEHHTFPNIAWVHLPKIKRIASEYFTNDSPNSYFQWWWLWAKSMFEPSRYHRY